MLASNYWMLGLRIAHWPNFGHYSQICSSPSSTPNIYPTAKLLYNALHRCPSCTLFEDQAYMALTCRTATALATEGIAIPDNVSKYDKKGMNPIYWNLRKPAKVPWDGAAGACGELCEIQAYKLSAKSQICLTIGAVASKFYNDIGRALDPNNML
jgi:hypothetical protein